MGTIRVRETKNGDVYIDSYFGDVKDKDNHDRFTVKISSGDGKPTGLVVTMSLGINRRNKVDYLL